MQQRERYLEHTGMTAGAGGHSRRGGSSSSKARSPYSSFSPGSPVAALPFSTLRGPQAAATAAAADSPLGAPRRLSQTFLGAGLPLSPPVLKQQPQQSAGCVTPTAAAGRGRGHTAQTERKPQAAAAENDATTDKGAASQGFGQVLWPFSGHAGSAGATSSGSGSSRQVSDFVPSQRRGKGAAKDAAGTGKAGDSAADRKKPAAAAQPKTGTGGAGTRAPGPRNAAAVRATAPPKAPSSRTFARQRQQLAQDLYALWNAQVGVLSHAHSQHTNICFVNLHSCVPK
jgi:hypothetical protein